MKTYLVKFYTKNRRGQFRDYKRIVDTEDIRSYIKKNFVLGVLDYKKKTFSSATEIVKSDRNFYDYKTLAGGEYYYTDLVEVVDGDEKSAICVAKSTNIEKYIDSKKREWIV